MQLEKHAGKGTNGMRALLIDDNEEMTEMLSTYLEMKGGISCTISNSGKEGFDKILTNNHDVVLLDIAMPGFSGFDVLKALELKSKLRDRKIIVLTASSVSDDELADLLTRGVTACMKKPIDLQQLLHVVRSCLKSPN